MALAASREVQKNISEQVRGMKVRSSVKKLCEGCKVRFGVTSSLSVRSQWEIASSWAALGI